jgi:hypothetical protein
MPGVLLSAKSAGTAPRRLYYHWNQLQGLQRSLPLLRQQITGTATTATTAKSAGTAPRRHYNMGFRKPLSDLPQHTGIPGVGDNSPIQHCACQLPRVQRSNDHCTQSNTVGRSGGKPHDKLGQWPVMTILYLQPEQHKKQQSATQLPELIVQPYNAAALSDCRSVLEEVIQGAGVLAS